MESKAKLFGALILVGFFFVAFGVSEWVSELAPNRSRAIGFVVGGFAMAAADLGIRRAWGEGDPVERYMTPGSGPHVSLAACWMVGVIFVLVGAALALQ